jgi:hypothetical protein
MSSFRNKVPSQSQQMDDVARTNATNNNRVNKNNNNRPFWSDTSNGPQNAEKESRIQNPNILREEYNVRIS